MWCSNLNIFHVSVSLLNLQIYFLCLTEVCFAADADCTFVWSNSKYKQVVCGSLLHLKANMVLRN